MVIKITIYPSYDHISRDLIYHFLWKHFGDKEELIRPWDDQSVMPDSDSDLMNLIVNKDDLAEDFRLLKAAVRMRGMNVPPNVTAYISASSQMMMFGTAVNRLMHNIEDTGILIPFDAVYREKMRRHIGAYIIQAFQSERRRKTDFDKYEVENLALEHWLNMRRRRIRRLLRKSGREFSWVS